MRAVAFAVLLVASGSAHALPFTWIGTESGYTNPEVSDVHALSPDGQTVFGRIWGDPEQSANPIANFEWTASGITLVAPFNPPSFDFPTAWTALYGTPVPELPSSFAAKSVSADGSTFGGWYEDGISRYAATWTPNGGVEVFSEGSGTIAISGDGSIIGGFAINDGVWDAAIWNDTGVHFIQDLLAAAGVEVDGTLRAVTAISADGRTFAGHGTRTGSAFGYFEAWVVTIPVPEPGTAMLLALGLATLTRRRTTG